MFSEFAGLEPSAEESNLFSNGNWSPENHQELNRSLEMAFRDTSEESNNRMESPDSGIHDSHFDFDIEGCSALLSGHDPILNIAHNSPIDQEVGSISTTDAAVINTTELLLPVVSGPSDNNYDIITPMESDDNNEEEDEEDKDTIYYPDDEEDEDQENDEYKSNKIDTNAIHSYSIMNIKKPKTMKSKRPANFGKQKQLVLTNKGQRFSVPVSRRKRKLYEMEPLADPVAERNRLNALNAKKNRDRKKQQLQMAEEEIDKLREENDELRAESENFRDQLDEARRELAALKQMFKARNGSLPPFLGNKVTPKKVLH